MVLLTAMLRRIRTDEDVKEGVLESNGESKESQPQTVRDQLSDDSKHHIVLKDEKAEEICRVCLNEGQIPIHGNTENSHIDFSKELNMFGGIEVSINDPYPKFMCQPCNDLLKSAILLRKTAQESDVHLRSVKTVNLDIIKDENMDLEPENMDDNIPIDILFGKERKQHDNYLLKFGDIDENNTTENQIRRGRKPIPTKCTKCNITFESLLIYKQHIREKHKKKRKKNLSKLGILSCIKCTVNFNSLREYKSHKISLHKDVNDLISCIKCSISFESLKEFREHRNSVHKVNRQVDKKTQECPICNRSFDTRYLPRHISTHGVAEKSFMCDICGKKFGTQGVLLRHKTTHSTDLPLECSLCPYKTQHNDLLKLHMRKHTGEKPYLCTECPARFITKSNLNRHIQTHKSTRNFQCDTCERGFYTKRQLEVHVKANHLGVKEHVCSTCGKAYGHRGIMLRHQRRVHKRKKMIPGIIPVYLKVEALKKQNEVCDEKKSI